MSGEILKAKGNTVTVHFQGHWLTITWEDNFHNISVYVDGKPSRHPDNSSIKIGFLGITALAATQEQVEIMHKDGVVYSNGLKI